MAKRARQSFAVAGTGAHVRVIREGDVVADDDPAVENRAELFEDAGDYIERVERATANPGELRNAVIAEPRTTKSATGSGRAKKKES